MSGDGSWRRQTVPTQLAALAAGVKESTIRKWASRGKLARYGSPGRAEYDLAELMAIVAADGPGSDEERSLADR
jgi:hypothetical protein